MLETKIDDQPQTENGIPGIWHQIRGKQEASEFYQHLMNGMIYWNELRDVLKVMFRQNKQSEVDFSPGWEYAQAYRIGYEKALQDVYKTIPRPKEKR